MKTLDVILKVFLWGLFLLVLLVGATLLAWWMRWPMFTGVFLVLGLVAVVCLFFAGRFFWRLRNKRRFVKQALSGLEEVQSAQAANSPLETLWNNLLLHERKSRGRVIDPRDFLDRAWYVALDVTGALSPIFAETPGASGQAGGDAVARHDFTTTTLLQVREEALGGADKEELLTLMARDVKKGVLRGLVLLLSLSELRKSGQDLHERGYLLRARLHELMAALNRDLPLYVLVEGVDGLPGGNPLFARPGMEHWGGCFFSGESRTEADAGLRAARAACALLRARFYDDMVGNHPASGDELACFGHLEALGGKLDQLFTSLLQEAPRHDPLRLSGIFFCPTKHETPEKTKEAEKDKSAGIPPHVVLARFFAQTLPAHGSPARALKGRSAAYSTGWLIGMSAWFAFLFAFCGLLAADVLYQKRALTTMPDVTVLAARNANFVPLQRQMRYILQLEEAQQRWLLPSFGLDALGAGAREEKQEFSRHIYREVLPPLIGRLQGILDATGREGYTEAQHAALTQLSWLAGAVNERIRQGKTKAPSIFFPLTDGDGWNTAGSELIRAGLNWTDNPEQLKLLSSELGSIIAQFIGDYFPVFSEAVLEYYNSANTDQQVCLSQYWPHLAVQGDEDFCVPAYYTAASYAVNSEFFNSFPQGVPDAPDNRAAVSQVSRFSQDRNVATNTRIRLMFDAYLKQYAEYWLTFAQKFSEVSANVPDESAYEPFYTIMNLRDTPHLKLLERMNRELAPLRNANPRPAWLADAELFEVMYAVAMEGHGEANPAAWHTLLMAGTRMPDVLQTLWQEADNREHMREIYDGIMGMTLYLDSVREVLHDLGKRDLSLTLARANFSGKEQEGLKQRPYQEAVQHLKVALARFPRRDQAVEMPQSLIFSSLLDFAGNGIVLEAALAVQHDWESKVLSSPIQRFNSSDTEKMYGKEGLVSTFVQTELADFLERRVDGTVAAVWDGRVFPFTDDFLHFIGTSEEWAARPHAAPESDYPVWMRSAPPRVNVDASAKPNGYTLNLTCQEKIWQLVNRNYPHDEYFVYNKARCGKVSLRVDFPSFTLERQWPDFLAFAQDFQYGEKDFLPEDFPESTAFLEKAKVRSLRVTLLPDGAARLLEDENANVPVVPERITYVRE